MEVLSLNFPDKTYSLRDKGLTLWQTQPLFPELLSGQGFLQLSLHSISTVSLQAFLLLAGIHHCSSCLFLITFRPSVQHHLHLSLTATSSGSLLRCPLPDYLPASQQPSKRRQGRCSLYGHVTDVETEAWNILGPSTGIWLTEELTQWR